MAIQFKELRKYLARNIRLSICFEDGHYHDYLMISDIPLKNTMTYIFMVWEWQMLNFLRIYTHLKRI